MTATIHPLPLPAAKPTRKEAVADAAEILLACGMTVEDMRELSDWAPVFGELAAAVAEARMVMTVAGAILDAAP